MLAAEHVTVRYGETPVLRDVSFRVEPGQWWMICGANGAGKSTLISAVTGALPYAGSIRLAGKEISRYRAGELARKAAVLNQSQAVGYGFTVREIVALGRYAYHTGFLRPGDSQGDGKIKDAMEMTGVSDLRDRSILTLSGGERQRVFLAQALAQDPDLLLLDEPANHLDLIYQKQMFSLIGEWLRHPGRAVMSVVHDLSMARHWGTHALLLHQGKPLAQGDISRVLTRDNLQKAYGMDVHQWMQTLLREWAE